jgi:hypothetical protein
MVRGESIMEGYERIGKGRGNWPLWYLLFQSLANTFGIAGRTLGCAALLWAAFPIVPLEVLAVGILIVTIAIIWLGRYAAVEMFVKIAIVVFAVAALTALLLQMPPPGEYLSNLAPVAAPAGAAMLFGAVVLNPIGLVPKGAEMGLTIASIYTETFGAWVFPVIIAGATAALFSTVFTYFDGQARIFEESCVRLRRAWDTPKMRMYLYRGFQIIWLVSGTAVIFGMLEPIVVVQIASVMALFFSPLLFWLTIQSLKNDFTGWEREYLPNKAMMAWAWSGVAALAAISAYVLYLQFVT